MNRVFNLYKYYDKSAPGAVGALPGALPEQEERSQERSRSRRSAPGAGGALLGVLCLKLHDICKNLEVFLSKSVI